MNQDKVQEQHQSDQQHTLQSADRQNAEDTGFLFATALLSMGVERADLGIF